MMVRRKRQFVGFGFDPGESAHHFAVILPEREEDAVTVEERFAWHDGSDAIEGAGRSLVVKVFLDRYRWDRIADAARGQFNARIRANGHRSVAWKKGQPNILPPHFGKELTLLAWAVEEMDESLIPNVIANWTGLEPEERWWLYTTVNATFTRAEAGRTGAGARRSRLPFPKTRFRRCRVRGSWKSPTPSPCPGKRAPQRRKRPDLPPFRKERRKLRPGKPPRALSSMSKRDGV